MGNKTIYRRMVPPKNKYKRLLRPKYKKPEDFGDFCKSFHGKRFFNTKKDQDLDKWEVWCYYRLGIISFQVLQDNSSGWLIWKYKNTWLTETTCHKYNCV